MAGGQDVPKYSCRQLFEELFRFDIPMVSVYVGALWRPMQLDPDDVIS